MKDYYQVLGISPNASTAQIKTAYRKLVQQYHPDVNPNPHAHVLIQEINEAYDVLGDSVKRLTYDNQRNDIYITYEPEPVKPQHRDPAYKRSYWQPVQKQESAQEILMKKCVPFFLKLSWVGCFTCLVLFVDRVWPSHVEYTQIRSFYNERVGRTTVSYIVTTEGRHLKISGNDWKFVETGQSIEIIESGIIRKVIKIWLPDRGKALTNLGTIYQNYLFVPIILFLLSVAGGVHIKSVETRFNLGIVQMFVLIFTWILIVK